MGKYLAQGHGVQTEHSEVCVTLTESQIFFHPAQPNLVKKYFIIRPIWRQIFLKSSTRGRMLL